MIINGIFPFRIDYKTERIDAKAQHRFDDEFVDTEFTVLAPPYRGSLAQAVQKYNHHEYPLSLSEAVAMATTICLDGGCSKDNGPLFDYSVNETILTNTRTIIQGIRLPKLLNAESLRNLDKLAKRRWDVNIIAQNAELHNAIFSIKIEPYAQRKNVTLDFDTPLDREGIVLPVINYAKLIKFHEARHPKSL